MSPDNPNPMTSGMRIAGEGLRGSTGRSGSPSRPRAPFPMLRLLLSLTCALAVTGCAGDDADGPSLRSATQSAPAPFSVIADTVTTPAGVLNAAVSDFFARVRTAPTGDFTTARLDLNGDGHEDGLVLLYGADWCGSGGCTLLVFEGTGDGYRLVSETSLVNGPVVVSPARSNGWRDILIPDPTEDRTVALQFNGAAYPTEPAGPAARSTAGDTVFEGEIGLF